MTDINIAFARKLLSLIAADVRAAGYRVNADAGVVGTAGDYYFFEGPKQFTWEGCADNAYEARYNGWSAFLVKFHGRV